MSVDPAPTSTGVNPPRAGQWRPALVACALALVPAAAVCVYRWVWPTAPAGESEHRAGHWAVVAQGRYYLGAGRPDLAFEAVAHVRDEAPGAGEAMTIAGLAMLHFGDLATARLALERGLKLQPDQPDAAKVLSKVYLSTGNALRAFEWLAVASRLAPTDPEPRMIAARARHDAGDPAGAAAALEDYVRLVPRDRDARVRLIDELLSAGQTDRATPWLEAALRDGPGDPRLLGLAARHAYDLGRSDEARSSADRALALDADSFDARLVRAKVGFRAGDLTPALADAERAAASRPNDLGALNLLAQIETQLGMTARAARTSALRQKSEDRSLRMGRLMKEINLHPDDPGLRWEMGHAAAEGGSVELAARCYRAALALDPGFQPARDSLAALGATPAAAPVPGP